MATDKDKVIDRLRAEKKSLQQEANALRAALTRTIKAAAKGTDEHRTTVRRALRTSDGHRAVRKNLP